MYQVQPSHPERFSLRLLLLHCPGATSFEDLRTVEGHTHGTFKEADNAMGLLEDDDEWRRCMQEAVIVSLPCQLRQLFTTLLIFNNPADETALFAEFQEAMAEDFLRIDRERLNNPTLPLSERHVHLCLHDIIQRLESHGSNVENYSLPPLPSNFQVQWNPQEQRIDPIHEQELGQQMYHQLNNEQAPIIDAILHAVTTQSQHRYYYIDGAGGTGKTFLYKTLVHILQGMQMTVACVAFSGIAATLLINGSTAHSKFQIPIPLLPESTCNISRQSLRARELLATTVFIWDEASMISARTLNVVDRLLKDLTGSSQPFGGKFFILGGDFCQVLPVVRHGSRAAIIASSLKNSPLWPSFQKRTLTTNMRALQDPDHHLFTNWLLRIGNGTEPAEDGSDLIELPQNILIPSNGLQQLLQHVYPNGPAETAQQLGTRCCLSPRNDECHVINELMISKLDSPAITYLSQDLIVADDAAEAASYPVEFLNSLTPSGMPLHKLQLKVSYSYTLTPDAPTSTWRSLQEHLQKDDEGAKVWGPDNNSICHNFARFKADSLPHYG